MPTARGSRSILVHSLYSPGVPDLVPCRLTDIGRAVTGLKKEHPTMSILMVTHYKRLLDHISPDKIHVMQKGQIITTGGMEIVDTLEAGGYAALSS